MTTTMVVIFYCISTSLFFFFHNRSIKEKVSWADMKQDEIQLLGTE